MSALDCQTISDDDVSAFLIGGSLPVCAYTEVQSDALEVPLPAHAVRWFTAAENTALLNDAREGSSRLMNATAVIEIELW